MSVTWKAASWYLGSGGEHDDLGSVVGPGWRRS
jgi:hypothetical protein